jgi:hypothetical protein
LPKRHRGLGTSERDLLLCGILLVLPKSVKTGGEQPGLIIEFTDLRRTAVKFLAASNKVFFKFLT